MPYKKVTLELQKLKNPEKIAAYQRFFKTAKGEYGEGDIFLGITVPLQRAVALKNLDCSFFDIERLLKNPIHEYRFTSLEILVAQYERGNEKQRNIIAKFYLQNSAHINNWDLVDTSAPYILGRNLFGKEALPVLRKLACSKNLWQKRIAIISTLYFINQNRFDETLVIAEMLLDNTHDLIHKAIGWMLREIYKRSPKTTEDFLRTHYVRVSRMTLRYAIERMSTTSRSRWLAGDIKIL